MKYRMEFDAIIVVTAETPREGLIKAEKFVANLDTERAENVISHVIGQAKPRVQIVGADMRPTVLTLSNPKDMDSIEGELRPYEIDDLEQTTGEETSP